MMDLVHDRASVIAAAEEEDRISNLPNDIIRRILGFLDIKYAIQFCTLSRKWRRIWTSMPELNLNCSKSGSLPQFGKFVKHVLSHRDNHTHVSAVKFTFMGNPTNSIAKSIINYAYMHNVTQLTMVWFCKKVREIPQCFFSSQTIKHLTLKYEPNGFPDAALCHIPNSVWDFPTLETLNLSKLSFRVRRDESLNFFSKCVNLKDLTLHNSTMSGVHIFNICAPQLSNLTITGYTYFPKVFNVVAPQLENFTASVIWSSHFLRLSTEGLDSLEKVNLSFRGSIDNYPRFNFIPQLLDLFQKLRSAKFLTLNAWIIEALALFMDQVSHEPCPFNKLKCLKIDMAPLLSCLHRRNRVANMAPQVKNYLLENSPNATFIIMDLPQVPPTGLKRPTQEVNNNTMANKVAKLDVLTVEPSSASSPSSSNVPHQISRQQIHNDLKKMANLEAVERQAETIPEDKIMLEAKIRMQDQLIAEQKAMFEAKIQMQDKVIANQNEKVQMQDEIIAKQKATFEAKIQMQDEVIANQKATFEAKLQLQDEVIAKQKAMFEAKTQMLEAAKLQHEKLISLIIKSKIAELKVKIESGNPDHEVIRSTGIDIGSVMELIPESLRVNLEARFSSLYEGFNRLFLTHIDDSQWAKIESQLEKEYNGFLE